MRWKPPGGWPLDHLLVGVATLRTTRELFRDDDEPYSSPPRAWDLALWSGVTPQGSADSMERLARLELVKVIPSGRVGYAPGFRLDRTHPLVPPLARLFEAERAMVTLARRREARSSSRAPGSATPGSAAPGGGAPGP